MYQVAYARMLKFVKIYLVQKSIKNFDKLPDFVKEEQKFFFFFFFKLARARVCAKSPLRRTNGRLKCLH